MTKTVQAKSDDSKMQNESVPKVMPDPKNPRLTERVTGIDQNGAPIEINVPVERALTLETSQFASPSARFRMIAASAGGCPPNQRRSRILVSTSVGT